MAEYPAGARKVAPLHPGKIVGATLDRLHISGRHAAEAMGVTATAINNVLAGKSGISPEMALRLGAYLGNGPELWLNLQVDYDLWHARKAIGRAVAKIKRIQADV